MLNRQTDNLANAVRLLTAMAGFAAAPGPKSGLGVYDALRKLSDLPPPGLATMAETLTRDAEAVLAGFRDAPPDAAILYEQMVAQALLTPEEIAAARGSAAACTTAMQAKLSCRAHTTGEMPRLFSDITRPALARLLADKTFARDLDPAYMQRLLSDTGAIRETTARTEAEVTTLNARVAALTDQLLKTQQALEARAAGVSERALIRLVRPIAEDVTDAGEAMVELANAVRIAVKVQEEGRHGSNLGAFVDEVLRRIAALSAQGEYEAATDTAEQALAEWRAQQEEHKAQGLRLLRSALDQNLLRRDAPAAAARIVEIVKVESASLRDLVPRLRRMGEEYYNRGRSRGFRLDLEISIEISKATLPLASDEVSKAAVQNDLGIALYKLGSRAGGKAGARLLAEAVDAYRAALRVYTETEQPVDWAATQINLGAALVEQCTGTGGEDSARLLAEAVNACRAALRIYTEAEHSVAWVTTQINLGATLRKQGSHTDGEAGARFFAEAVDAYGAALRVCTEAEHPADWAMTQNNLGNALMEQGRRTGGEDGARLLAEAVDAYRAALRVYTETEHPVDRAATQNNYGIALEQQGSRTGGEAGAALLADAVDAYRAAFRVRTEAEHPVDWAMTQNNLGIALAQQGSRTGGEAGAALLAEAVDAYRAAFRVRTEAEHPVDWAMTQNNLGLAHEVIAAHETCADPRAELTRAAECVESALRAYDPEHMPRDHRTAAEALERITNTLAALG